MLDQRGRLLAAALGFLALEPRAPEPCLLHRWLDTWSGIGHVVAGTARRGYDVELRRYDGQGWRATFYAAGFERSRTAYSASAWAPNTMQRAAADTVHRVELGESRRAP